MFTQHSLRPHRDTARQVIHRTGYRRRRRCLILAPTHRSILDPWLIMSALKRSPPVAKFAPGIVYLQRKSGADIVPVAMWMSERTAELYDRARRGAGTR